MIAVVRENGSLVEKRLPLHGHETGSLVGNWLSEGQIVSIHSVESTLADIFIKVTGRKLA